MARVVATNPQMPENDVFPITTLGSETMPLARVEIETIVRLGYYDEVCTVVTGDPKYKRDLEEKGATLKRTSRIVTKWSYKEVNGDKCCDKPLEWEDATWEFECPAEWFRLPRKPKEMSDEQRKAAGERLKARRKD